MVNTLTYISIGAVVAMLAIGGGAYALYSADKEKSPDGSDSTLYTYDLSKLSSLEKQVLYDELFDVCDTLIVKTNESDVYYSSFYIGGIKKMYGFKYNSQTDVVIEGDPYRLDGFKSAYSPSFAIQIQKGSFKANVTEISFYSDKEPTVLP